MTKAPMTKREATKGFAWNLLFTVIGRVFFPLAFGIALNRILGPFNVGAFATLASFSTVLDLLRDFGIAQNFVADRSADERREGQYFSLAMAIGLTLAALFWACQPLVSAVLGLGDLTHAIGLMALAMAGTAIAAIPGNKLQKDGRFREYGMIDTGALFFSGSLSLALAVAGFGVWALIWAVPVRAWTSAIFYMRFARMKPAKPTLEFSRSIVSKCMATLSNSLLSVGYTMGDTAFVGRQFGLVNAGYYSTAFAIALKPVELVSWPLGRTLLVVFSQHKDDPVMLRNIFGRVLSVVVLLACPIFGLVGMCADQVVTLLYGNKFAPAGPLLQVLCIYLGLRSVGTVMGGILVSIGRPGLSNFGWLAAYGIMGVGIFTDLATRNVYSATQWLTAGASIAFLGTVASAWYLIRPKAADLKSAARSLGLNAALFLLVVVLSRSFEGPAGFMACLAAVGLVYPVAVALALTGCPKDLLSKSGLKRLWGTI